MRVPNPTGQTPIGLERRSALWVNISGMVEDVVAENGRSR